MAVTFGNSSKRKTTLGLARKPRKLRKPITFPSLNVDLDPGGYLEDLGPIFEVLGVMASSILKALKKEVDSSIQIEHFMENCREIKISDFGFRSTFNEGSVSLCKRI